MKQISNSFGEATQEEGWVICKVFKKKLHLQKTSDCSNNYSSITSEIKHQLIMDTSSSDTLDQILQCMGRSCKQEKENTETNHSNMRHLINPIETLFNTGTIMHERFPKLPPLENPTIPSVQTDWTTVDSFTACQLNRQQLDTSKQMGALFDEPGFGFGPAGVKLINSINGEEREIDNAGCAGGDGDLWSFTRSCVYSPCMAYIDNLSP